MWLFIIIICGTLCGSSDEFLWKEKNEIINSNFETIHSGYCYKFEFSQNHIFHALQSNMRAAVVHNIQRRRRCRSNEIFCNIFWFLFFVFFSASAESSIWRKLLHRIEVKWSKKQMMNSRLVWMVTLHFYHWIYNITFVRPRHSHWHHAITTT